jgi:hypothetical protein
MPMACFYRRLRLRLRHLAVLCFLCAHAIPGIALGAEAQEADLYPPLVPEGESAAPDSADFVANCLSILKDRLPSKILGAQLVTKTERWGTILRIDFEVPGYPPTGRVNRMMCWGTPDKPAGVMFAVGQAVPPLQPR